MWLQIFVENTKKLFQHWLFEIFMIQQSSNTLLCYLAAFGARRLFGHLLKVVSQIKQINTPDWKSLTSCFYL